MKEIVKPTLLVHRDRARRNIRRMAAKADGSGIRFRPHFKTHQSAEIGDWFRDAGVDAITVSSFDMAMFFAGHGWRDIAVAFPVNILEIQKINTLARTIHLHLLVEDSHVVEFLADKVEFAVGVWIKIDVGYHRTGIPWTDSHRIQSLARLIDQSPRLQLFGILTHSGHSYKARGGDEIRGIYATTVDRMKQVKEELSSIGLQDIEISIGDTPTCSVVDTFNGIDEIRPGNFVFYDLMQLQIGSCSEEEIAAAVVCPVVAKHPERGEIVLYGGAVHLSKEVIEEDDGIQVYGRICRLEKDGWSSTVSGMYVSGLSQEHGIVRTTGDFFNQVRVGDRLAVLPVHSCLAMNLLRTFDTI